MSDNMGLALFILLVLGKPGDVGAPGPALTAEVSRMEQMAARQPESRVIERLSAGFQSFLGSEAQSVIAGLRKGTAITMAGSAPPAETPRSADPVTTIKPPTGKMGFGNVFVSLALAKQELGYVGIRQPNPFQLRAVLLGGSVKTRRAAAGTADLKGILRLRSQNMEWSQIAGKLNLKLAPVVSSLRSVNQTMVLRSRAGVAPEGADGSRRGPDEPT